MLSLATQVAIAANEEWYSPVFENKFDNSAILQVILLNREGDGEVRAEFQGSASPAGTFVTTGPAPINLGSVGEVRALDLGVSGFPFLRIRFSSLADGVAVFSASLVEYLA